MRIYLSLLVLVCINCGISFSIQFKDDDDAGASDLGQTNQDARAFFPSNDEPDDNYSEVSGIKYVDDYESFNSQNRKQLNFNGNTPVHSPPAQIFLSENQFHHQQPPGYRPSINSFTSSPVRQRPKFPYKYVNPQSHYSSDLTSPFYQNYANYYQHTSPTYQHQTPQSSSIYYDYYNPTRYPSTQTSSSANFYGHQALHQSPSYYTNNYANQYAYQRPTLYPSSGSSLYGNIRDTSGPLGQLSTVGAQFSKALEDISINDDLQCVPKLLCQMIRNPRRPVQLPSFLNIPGITAIISALPSSSPLMNFGRAALLGLSGDQCDSAYPRCPRDDNQLLYYLNNHRGGFFRFFNGGSSFGGDDEFLQQQASTQQPQQSNQGLNLLALQALAETLGGGGGGNSFNLNNLLSSTAVQPQPQTQQYYQGLQADSSQSIGGLLSALKPSTLSDVVSNLLTGVIGNRFSRNTRHRRSLQFADDADENHKIQRRIVNLRDSVVKFDDVSPQQVHKNTLFDELEKPFKFSNDNRITSDSHRQQSYALKFPHDIKNSENPQGAFVSSADVLRRLKVLFPDADTFSEQFTKNLLRLMMTEKGREVLADGQRPINNLSIYSVNRYPSRDDNVGSSSNSNINYNYYNGYDHRQQQKQHQNKVTTNANRSHIVYVTNKHGQIEYTLNELTGEKKYL